MDLKLATALKEVGFPQISGWSVRCPSFEEVLCLLPKGIEGAVWEKGECTMRGGRCSSKGKDCLEAVALLWIEQNKNG